MGRVTITPSYNGVSLKSGGGLKNFWRWGMQDSLPTTPGKKNIEFFDFKTDRFNSRMTAIDRNMSNLSNSHILNDELSKAEIEKMEIKKKIHDLMKVL